MENWLVTLIFMIYLINGNTKNDLRLQSNDAILINPTGNTDLYSGEVKKQAKFELLEMKKILKIYFFFFRIYKPSR